MPKIKPIEDFIEDAKQRGHRGKDGLTKDQRAFLRARLTTLDDLEALELSKTERADLERWQSDDAFTERYGEIVPKTGLAQARQYIDSLMPSAIAALERALQGEELNKTQRFAINALLKVGGLQRIYLDVTHTEYPVEAVLAIDMLRRGELPPPGMVELAQSYFRSETEQLLPKALPPGEIIEGEVREIT